MATVKCSAPPFSIQLLGQHAVAGQGEHDRLLTLLPALYRKESGDLAAVGQHVMACVEEELDLRRLASIHGWLWVAGLPLPPRALHHQLLLGREIFVTERMDMHLVWTAGRIFLKPIPRFLLDRAFWAQYLCCGKCRCSPDTSSATQTECRLPGLRQRALGFLFSYAALLLHESDFRIAQDKHLVPPEVTWYGWRMLVGQLDTEHIYPRIDPRFVHGELRLSRLNKIYALARTPMRGYIARWDRYGAFFHDHFAWLASATVYIAIVLTAMQVGLATESLGHNDAFQSAAYGFTVFSILGPLTAASVIILRFSGIFTWNWVKAVHRKRTRYSKLRLTSV
ncbi:hypothetical protein ISF_08219 [Cordyceps fumosorosea ARSEF 2679]|uniref:Subtilisin-like serine protease n=1 Tax=Cordyceps fumosorosea (strain ARSEF 2679) TaxID=1081104 RepID=A0A167MPR0_CORFA|nr:hypothetical protein ISF_08219 [Cordyceps fumosorosea ARSEF 2679]OAA54618.1 hypothetical protein ISF_08219 [Cordyceps fumosorosea ARSEF 2679]